MNGVVEVVQKNKCLVSLTNAKNDSTTTIESVMARNDANATPGQIVSLSESKKDFSLVIKTLYFMPLVGLLLGFLIGLVFEKTITQFLFAISVFVANMLMIICAVLVLKHVQKKKYVVVKIIEGENDNGKN